MSFVIPEWYRQKRKEVEAFFTDENRVPGDEKVISSPSGRFHLKVERYETGENTWAFTSCTVVRSRDGAVIAVIRRNFSHFWHAWVQQGDREFLLCGEDYQGYSVLEPDKREMRVFIEENAKQGNGFCWVQVTPSSDGVLLVVEGCYWAGPYQVRVYDFSTPDIVPLPLLKDFGAEKQVGESEFVRWLDSRTIEVKVTRYEDEEWTKEKTALETCRLK